MKYETPELTALTPAVNAIQGSTITQCKLSGTGPDSPVQQHNNEFTTCYADWE